MSQLSKQTIRKLCENTNTPLITPFNPDKVREHGVSRGLSHASYDASIDHDLVLGVHPGVLIKTFLLSFDLTTWRGRWAALRNLPALALYLKNEPKWYALAYTVEDFHFPDNVSGQVCDKSTFARLFVSAYNTFFDPGFHGNATLELVNDSDQLVVFKRGQAVCQFVFNYLDEPTEAPYDGKYQHQTKAAHPARFESGQ